MSLTAAIQIGRSALTASQLGIQVTGSNIANIATPGYSRQTAILNPMRGENAGRLYLGRGVQVSDVQRQIDQALQGRLWSGLSAESAADQRYAVLSQIQATLAELSGRDVSSELTAFFNSWSELSNGNQSSAIVVQQGARLAEFLRSRRDDLSNMRLQSERQLGQAVTQADTILTQVAELNGRIAEAESGGATANTLRDQRDQLISQLSQYVDVSVIEQGSRTDILVASTPVVLGNQSLGLELRRTTENNTTRVDVTTRSDGTELDVRAGQIGALLADRSQSIDTTIADLDRLATNLIFEVNKLHATATNAAGLASTSSTLTIASSDRTRAINDPANISFSGLPFRAVNGGFTVRVANESTGESREIRVNVDLDGITNAGTPGTADDTTPEQLRAALDAIPGLSAAFTPDGKLDIRADDGVAFSFKDDSSSVLAVIGVNAYFTGTTSDNIAVRPDLAASPNLLCSGRYVENRFVQNATALEITRLRDKSLPDLNDRTMLRAWGDTAQRIGSDTSGAEAASKSARIVREGLDAQRQGLSGVSMDEEAINMLSFQRQYQGAARLIDIADQMFQTLVSLV